MKLRTITEIRELTSRNVWVPKSSRFWWSRPRMKEVRFPVLMVMTEMNFWKFCTFVPELTPLVCMFSWGHVLVWCQPPDTRWRPLQDWRGCPGRGMAGRTCFPSRGGDRGHQSFLFLHTYWLFLRKTVPDTEWKCLPTAGGNRGVAGAHAHFWRSPVRRETTFHVHWERTWSFHLMAAWGILGNERSSLSLLCGHLSRCSLCHSE